MPGILGKKIGMTRIFGDNGKPIPLTIVQCVPNEVTQVKTLEKDGYSAIVLGFQKLKNPKKNKQFYFKKEFRIENEEQYKKGSPVTVEMFQENEKVKISGISKGKGFQGVIKRFHFAGGPASHGSHHHREPGSIGARAKPGRVHKGKRLPGHMGSEMVTLKKAPIAYLNKEEHLIGIKGPIPGSKNSLVIIRKIS